MVGFGIYVFFFPFKNPLPKPQETCYSIWGPSSGDSLNNQILTNGILIYEYLCQNEANYLQGCQVQTSRRSFNSQPSVLSRSLPPASGTPPPDTIFWEQTINLFFINTNCLHPTLKNCTKKIKSKTTCANSTPPPEIVLQNNRKSSPQQSFIANRLCEWHHNHFGWLSRYYL